MPTKNKVQRVPHVRDIGSAVVLKPLVGMGQALFLYTTVSSSLEPIFHHGTGQSVVYCEHSCTYPREAHYLLVTLE